MGNFLCISECFRRDIVFDKNQSYAQPIEFKFLYLIQIINYVIIGEEKLSKLLLVTLVKFNTTKRLLKRSLAPPRVNSIILLHNYQVVRFFLNLEI